MIAFLIFCMISRSEGVSFAWSAVRSAGALSRLLVAVLSGAGCGSWAVTNCPMPKSSAEIARAGAMDLSCRDMTTFYARQGPIENEAHDEWRIGPAGAVSLLRNPSTAASPPMDLY